MSKACDVQVFPETTDCVVVRVPVANNRVSETSVTA